jgi:transcriptional regulator GlxA family with amidase domain
MAKTRETGTANAPRSAVGDIAVVALPGSFLSSIGTLVDSFALVARQVQDMYAAPYRVAMQSKVRLLTLTGQPLGLAGGRALATDGDLDWPGPLQLIHVAAFEAPDEESLLKVLTHSRRLLEWLRRQRDKGTVIGAAGTALFALAEAGLLDKGPAAVPGTLSACFRRRYPLVRPEKRTTVVEHDGVFTVSAMTDEWLLVTKLVERCLSPHMSRWLTAITGLKRDRDSVPLSDDQLVAAAQFWLGERFARPFRIADLARDLAVSHSTLLRRFERNLSMTPRHYAQVLRIESAKKMLLTTQRSVEQVGSMVGYADIRSFRAAFSAQVRMSPTRYRRSGGK